MTTTKEILARLETIYELASEINVLATFGKTDAEKTKQLLLKLADLVGELRGEMEGD